MTRTSSPDETLQPGPAPAPGEEGEPREHPAAAVAARLGAALAGRKRADVLYVASGERRADEIARALAVLAPGVEPVLLPAWDCLPYDRASPSREVMGRRMAALARLAAPAEGARVLVASPEALVQRLPPADALADAAFVLRVGDALDREALAGFAARTGYGADDRTDEPGELLILGEVVDVWPPDRARPVRARLDAEGRIDTLETYDPLTQRTDTPLEDVRLGPASELVLAPGSEDGGEGGEADAVPVEREPGCEHRLAQAYPSLRTVFDLLPKARVVFEPGVAERAASLLEQVDEAFRTQRDFADASAPVAEPPDALYLSAEQLAAGLDGAQPLSLDLEGVVPAPRFATAANPGRAFSDAVKAALAGGRRVVLTGLRHELRPMGRALERGLDLQAQPAADWAAAAAGEGVAALEADLSAGWEDVGAGLLVLAASDVLGGRVASRRPKAAALLAEPELRVGDVVIHEDHGVGVLRDLDRVEAGGLERDVLRLEYYGGDTVLAPVEEFGRIWRYGAEAEAVTLDRLKGDGWNKRRAAVSVQIDEDARALVARAREREAATADPVAPPKAAYARFAARFAFPETPDQRDAIAAVLADLAGGRPMDRLVCGDVGFGKTEVALRAAAAVALAGRQVALAAPTTVLARQHAQSFERRFAGTGIRVAQLSRLVDGAEAKAVKAGLASGEIGVVVGTHALGSEGVRFHDLALMILDEEQKFGAKLKAALHAKAPHLLAMTATPIPRTLQAAMVGVQEVSVIASPPARRRPIRTFLAPFDAATLRTALLREKRRGGQSFVVAPRISDLDALRERLAEVVPELSVALAHGELPAEEVDATMVDFADGRGDVLLATNIIESGLDVPRANTMLVWRADRFGLSQLHQLRGRVGRGRVQGVAYLFTDPEEEISDATRARLSTLEAFDRLGAGLDISARDLDLRGGGDLQGEEQAGHMKMIGAALQHRLMTRAVRVARGEALEPDWTPELQLGEAAVLPPGYIPDAVVRINLYARLSRLASAEEADAFEEELDDRFGPLPPETAALVGAARLGVLARAAGVRKVTAGPAAVALDLDRAAEAAAQALAGEDGALTFKPGRLVLAGEADDGRMGRVANVLERLRP